MTIRLMAGHELATEGFRPGQVGSSAMPHKMNARSCERINGLKVVLGGHLAMVTSLAGAQWNEGDVSCSVVRRVALPDAFFAIDGLFETFLTVLGRLRCLPGSHRPRAAPVPAVPHDHQGVDRGRAQRRRPRGRPRDHQGPRRRGGIGDAGEGPRRQRPARPPGRRRAARPRAADVLASLVAEPLSFVGTAEAQVAAFVSAVEEIAAADPAAAAYSPAPIV